MTTLRHGAAALTGAASGIGRALAMALAAEGCDLALADRDLDGLQATARAIAAAHQVKVTLTRLDVSDRAAVQAFAAEAIEAHPGLKLVINNAGVALLGPFHAMAFEDFTWLMNINFWGAVHGCEAFLPHLAAQPEAHVVNLSSVFGLVAPPGQTAYAASKFAVRGFTEALRHECVLRGGTIKVSCVHPGGIKTGIVRNARLGASLSNQGGQLDQNFNQIARTSPEQAAARILRGILRNEPRILIGPDARVIDWLQRLFPTTHMAWLGRLTGRKGRPAGFGD